MDCTASRLSYKETGYFSKIILDYLDGNDSLRSFYAHPVSLEGIKAAIHAREKFDTDRQTLVAELKKRYGNVQTVAAVNENIEKLLSKNTFTITTAHQPAIFTGTLYFIYKILHCVSIAEKLVKEFPDKNFVPVYYMGSEDADLDELGKIFLDGEKIEWDTKQTGAVGRMKTKGLEKIITSIEGEFYAHPFGNELIELLKTCYQDSENVQTATFKLVHALFAKYGVIVMIADDAVYKKQLLHVFEQDLFHETSSSIVEKTIEELAKQYKVQANPRAINLFYLKDNLRGRIEKSEGRFIVHGSDTSFSDQEIRNELQQFPERFSPNVILRGMLQETILPNIVFIGGGGEMAYWLELKNLFAHYQVPYPMLVLRNSFLVIEKKWKEKIGKLQLTPTDIFKTEESLINELVRSKTENQLSLEKEIAEANAYYNHLKTLANKVDSTLTQHTEALQAKALKPLKELEKKLLRAEKRKFEEQQQQLHKIKTALFPLNNLQERIDNFIPYYAKWGTAFIDALYKNSLALEQEFVVLEEE